MCERRGVALLAWALSLALQGCAHVSVDADGTRHVSGFMRLTLPPPNAGARAGADALRVQALGLSVIRTPAVGTSIVLGYGDGTLVVMRNDAQVCGAALAAALRMEDRR